jgi:uncharacterized protein (DUF779 family)
VQSDQDLLLSHGEQCAIWSGSTVIPRWTVCNLIRIYCYPTVNSVQSDQDLLLSHDEQCAIWSGSTVIPRWTVCNLIRIYCYPTMNSVQSDQDLLLSHGEQCAIWSGSTVIPRWTVCNLIRIYCYPMVNSVQSDQDLQSSLFGLLCYFWPRSKQCRSWSGSSLFAHRIKHGSKGKTNTCADRPKRLLPVSSYSVVTL